MKLVITLLVILMLGALPVFAQEADDTHVCEDLVTISQAFGAWDQTVATGYLVYMNTPAAESVEDAGPLNVMNGFPAAPSLFYTNAEGIEVQRLGIKLSESEIVVLAIFKNERVQDFGLDFLIRDSIRLMFPAGVNSFSYRPAAQARQFAANLGYSCPEEQQ